VIARRLALAFGWVLLAGCGVTHLQSARTTPRGHTRTTIGASLVHLGDRGGFHILGDVPAAPLDIMVRHGATDRVDWGIRLLFGLGLLGDVKWNLLDPARATALSVSAGAGGAVDSSAGLIHVPVGYGAYWIIGYGDPMSGVSYAGRSYTGDGLLMLRAGIELTRATGRAFFLEYGVGLPVVNDPGDFYGFATNHFFSIAFRTGRGNLYGRGLDPHPGRDPPSGPD
jgi:hypothetical protein